MQVFKSTGGASRIGSAAAAAFLVLAAAAVSGCASGKAVAPDPVSSAGWSTVPGTSPAMPVAALPAGERWVAAWIDADFSGPDVAFDVTAISFFPSPGGDVRFRPAGPAVRAQSWAQVRAALSVRGGGKPLGVFFTAGGIPVLRVGSEPPPAMRDFLRLFLAGLEDADVDFVLLVPSSFVFDDGMLPDGARGGSENSARGGAWEF